MTQVTKGVYTSLVFALLIVLVCHYYAYEYEEIYILEWREEHASGPHWLHYRNIVVGPSFMFWGMFLISLTKFCVCCKQEDYTEVEQRLPELKIFECVVPAFCWLAGFQFLATVIPDQAQYDHSYAEWIPRAFIMPLMAAWHCILVKEKVKPLMIVGIILNSLAFFTWAFVQPDNWYYDTTVWAFFRNCIAMVFLTFAIGWVEKLLKLRRCRVQDVMFHIGWIGMIFAGIESIVYVFVNGATINKPVLIQYLAAVFGTFPDFMLTIARLITTGLTINICFILTKYSTSLKMWAFCGFYQCFAYMVIFLRYNSDYYIGAYVGYGVWECFSYALCFANAQCGEDYLTECQEKNPISGGLQRNLYQAAHQQPQLPYPQPAPIAQPQQQQVVYVQQPQQQVIYAQQPQQVMYVQQQQPMVAAQQPMYVQQPLPQMQQPLIVQAEPINDNEAQNGYSQKVLESESGIKSKLEEQEQDVTNDA